MFWRKKKKNVIFLHIPKTGGMTLSSILDNEYAHEERYSLDLNQKNIVASLDRFKTLSFGQRKKIKLLKGHMDFGMHTYLSGESTYITMLRDPVERVISNYYFVTGSKNHPMHDFFKDKSLLDVVRLPESKFNNGQVAMIAGTHFIDNLRDIGTLEKAKEHIDKYFPIVGFTERFDETLILLKKKFAWKIPAYIKKNVTQKKRPRDKISREIIETIEEYNKFDIELYRFAEEKFDKQISEYGKMFYRDLSEFKEKLNR